MQCILSTVLRPKRCSSAEWCTHNAAQRALLMEIKKERKNAFCNDDFFLYFKIYSLIVITYFWGIARYFFPEISKMSYPGQKND